MKNNSKLILFFHTKKMKVNMKVKPPIFIIEKMRFLTKKRNISTANLGNLSTSNSPNKRLKKEDSKIIKEEKRNESINNSVKIQNNNQSNSKKTKWTQNEDELLIDCVNKFGLGKWNEMKNCFIGRTRKQIRQRYIIIIKKKKISEDKVQPISLNTSTLTDDEKTETNNIKELNDAFKWNDELDKILLKEYFLNKKSWVKISKKIPGSSENSVKNRFYSLLRQLVNKTKKSFKCNLSLNSLCSSKEIINNNYIFLLYKEIFGNKIKLNNEYNNLIVNKKMLFVSKSYNSICLNNKSKQKNYSVKILLSFLPELLTDKGVNIEEIIEELNQRKINAATQIFVIIERYFNCNKCDNKSVSTEAEFEPLKNEQTEKLGKVLIKMDIKVMSKYFYRFRYNTLGI